MTSYLGAHNCWWAAFWYKSAPEIIKMMHQTYSYWFRGVYSISGRNNLRKNLEICLMSILDTAQGNDERISYTYLYPVIISIYAIYRLNNSKAKRCFEDLKWIALWFISLRLHNYSKYCEYRSIKMPDLFSWAIQVCTSTGAPCTTHHKNYEIFKNSRRSQWNGASNVFTTYFVVFN